MDELVIYNLVLIAWVVVRAICDFSYYNKRINLMIEDKTYLHCIKYVEAMNDKEYEEAEKLKVELVKFFKEEE